MSDLDLRRAPVPFVDLAAADAPLADELVAAAERVLRRGDFVLGAEVEAFESAWAEHCGVAHAVGVASGLDALVLTLSAVGIGPGDEVLVPASTFAATWLAVLRVGASPVPVEVDPSTSTIDVDAVEAAGTSRTAAVVPVHLYGRLADMDRISAIADRNGWFVLEDAAQAHGARRGGRRAGALGHAGAFSCYPTKNLGAAGDGGIVTTDDAALAARIRRLRNYGNQSKYLQVDAGWNSRLDEIQAALLTVKLRHLDHANGHRRRLADRLTTGLAGIDGLELPPPAGDDHVWHLYVVRTAERDRLAASLAEAGIGTGCHYPVPVHLQPAYGHLGYAEGSLPVSERLSATVLSLPMGPHVDDDAADRVVEAVRAAC
ncbi:MAG: DegT/DnrJ/EryC1/StrS family aminotransferase [Actinomycetota bacterium]